jgi:phenylacetyl-CoA:acceptor oxidoreductase subunit 1
MIADLERCVGCQTCTAACRHANATSPAVQWRKVLDVEAGTFPNVSRTFVPVGCQHCADPPCVHACPTSATRQRADGIVTMDYDLCIGCAYCEVACPYQARFLVDERHYAYATALANETEREEPARLGVAQKCTYCSDRVDFGLENGLTPGVHPGATPACVNSCIADALHFGDLDNPDSNVSRLLREQKHFRMHDELGTQPNFLYLYGKAGDADAPVTPAAEAEPGKIRTRGVEPWHQPHWDWKAAGNFLCGGAGAGLFTAVALAAVIGAPYRWLALTALAVVALGLFGLMFKIGRPMRFIYVLRQPYRSWMAREAWVAVVFFPLALVAIWLDNFWLLVVAAVLGLIFLCCQAMILRDAKGIPAWRTPSIVPLIVITGLAEGAGLFLAAVAFTPAMAALVKSAAAALAALVILRAVVAWIYLASLRHEGAPTRSLDVLSAQAAWFFALGLIAPLAAMQLGVILGWVPSVLLALSGLLTVGAGWWLKFVIVTRAGFNQGFALARTPVRGGGSAGPAVKPGWSLPVA